MSVPLLATLRVADDLLSSSSAVMAISSAFTSQPSTDSSFLNQRLKELLKQQIMSKEVTKLKPLMFRTDESSISDYSAVLKPPVLCGPDSIPTVSPTGHRIQRAVPGLMHGKTVPFGADPMTIDVVKGKSAFARTIVFSKTNIPKPLQKSHNLAYDLKTLEMAITADDDDSKSSAKIGTDIVATIRGKTGCVQVYFYEDEDDEFGDCVFVDARRSCPVLDTQLYSVECYSDDAQFDIIFFR